MSKKISFSSVLRDKANYEQTMQPMQMGLPSLASLVQQYAYNPQGNYTLNLGSIKPRNLRQNPSRKQVSQIDFQQGANQLDEWINSHSSQSQNNYQNQFNKQNSISNLQYGRKSTTRHSPVKGPHSPRYNSGINAQGQVQKSPRNKMGGISRTKNLSMNQLSKMYVENKNSQISANQSEYEQERSRQEPVWKFSSQNQEEELDYNQSRMNPKRTPQIGNQKYKFNQTSETTQQTFRPQQTNIYHEISNQIEGYKSHSRLNEQQNQFLQKKYDNLKQQHIQQIYPSPHTAKQTKKQNLDCMIEKIKTSLSEQIETMANKIIEEREKAQLRSIKDEELLISQRESESEKQKRRMENLQSEINEYLKIKNGSSQNRGKAEAERMEYETKNDLNDANSGVGYSFASEFNSKIASNIKQEEEEKESELSPSQNTFLKKQTKMKTSQQKAFCLPNIDEVRSEHDYNQTTEKDKIMGSRSQYAELVKNYNSNNVEIDSKYIKEIQSVAYGYQEPQISNSFRNKLEVEPTVQGRPSLNEKVAKLSMSMSVAQNQANQSSKDQIYRDNGDVCSSIDRQGEIKNDKLIKQETANDQFYHEISMKKQENSSEIGTSLNRMADQTKQKNQSIKKSPPLAFKQSKPDLKSRQFHIQQSNKSSNSNGNKENSGVSEHKRLLKITLSPKYQQNQQNNVTVTNFAEEMIKPEKPNDSINQINSSISNHIKLDSYFGTKKVQKQESSNFSITREPMIKNAGNESKREIKISMKNSMGAKESIRKSIKGSCSEDKFQFDLDF